MNPDGNNDSELREFGRWMDRFAPTATADVDEAWEALATRLERDRTRRTVLRVTAAVVVLVLAVGGVLAELTRRSGEQGLGSNEQQLDTVIAEDPLTEPVADTAPVGVPALTRLPGCAAWGDLTSWADGAVGEWGVILEHSDWVGTKLSDVIDRVPVPRDTDATCIVPIASSNSASAPDVVAFALQGADGTVLARAVSAPHAGNVVPPEIVNAKPEYYHQETVGSGQQFSGNLEDGVGVGISGVVDARRLVVLDLSTLYPAGGEQHTNNTALLGRLTFDHLTGLNFGNANMPTRVPLGYGRCGGTEPVFAVYCNELGEEITLQQTLDASEPEAGDWVDRPGFRLRALVPPPERQRWRIDQGDAPRSIVEAPAEVPVGALAEMLQSVPLFDPRLAHPASGVGDLRPTATADWVVHLLEGIPGTEARAESSPSDQLAMTSFTWRGLNGRLSVYPDPEPSGNAWGFSAGIGNTPFEIKRIGALDVVFLQLPNGWAGQTFIHCGQVEWNLFPPAGSEADVQAFVAALVGVLPCNQ